MGGKEIKSICKGRQVRWKQVGIKMAVLGGEEQQQVDEKGSKS
jgi:hypothetical protein